MKSNNASIKDIAYWKRRALTAELTTEIVKIELTKDVVQPTFFDRDREIAALRERMIAMENSRSWKITAPLRYAIEVITRRRQLIVEPISTKDTKRSTPVSYGEQKDKMRNLSEFISPDDLADWQARLSHARKKVHGE